MRAPELDWRHLRWPALAAATAAAVLAVTAYSTLAEWRERQRVLAAAEHERAQATARLDEAQAQPVVYRRYAERFRAMRARGWVGESESPDWRAVLTRLERDTPVARLRYEAGEARAPASSEGPLAGEAITLTARPMQVGLAALHEGAIVTALERLARNAPGLMALQRCRLERMRPSRAIAVDGERANIRARCRLRWYRARLDRQEGHPS